MNYRAYQKLIKMNYKNYLYRIQIIYISCKITFRKFLDIKEISYKVKNMKLNVKNI